MPTNFPTGLDAFPNPAPTDLVENATLALDHDQQHGSANDAIEALEAEVGVTGSTVVTSLRYLINRIKETFTRDTVNGRIYPLTATDDVILGGTSTEWVTGAEFKMFYDQSKTALRGGYFGNTNSNDANRGSYSIAWGINSVASSSASVAFGDSTSATASGASAFGNSTNAAANQSIAFGIGTVAAGQLSVAGGRNSRPIRTGQWSRAPRSYLTEGDAQANMFAAAAQTTDATATQLFFDNTTAPILTGEAANVLTIPVSRAHRFEIKAVARRADSTSDLGGWTIRGTIGRGATGNAFFVSTPSVESDLTTGAAAWVLAVSINTTDATNNYLAITATGQAGATIRWVADISTAEVG